eukprot:c15589_g1_i1 orf=22-1440(+)
MKGAPSQACAPLSGRRGQGMSTLVEDQPDIGQVIEDNILALLDTVGVKNADDIEDDKMSFIEAVCAVCIASIQPKAPTCRVHKALYHLLEGNHSMVLNVASYSLLVEIAQQYPHILVKENTSNDMKRNVVLNNKIWSPFHVDIVEEKGRGGVTTRQANQGQQYCEDFVSLLEEILSILGGKPWGTPTKIDSEEITKSSYHKVIGLVLKFKYLFKILEHDFKCWFQVYKDAKKKEILSNCYLVHLFEGSRLKPLLELLFNVIAHTSSILSNCGDEFLDLQEFSLSLQALVEMRLALELESVRMSSTSPRKTRTVTDASRNQSVMELFTEAFHFNKEILKTLLQVMEDSDCKLRIIFANFLKDVPKPVLKEKKIGDINNMKPEDVLKCFEDINSARNVNKAIDSTVLQVYLASAFKVGLRQTKPDGINMATVELCKSLKTAFHNLQSVNRDFDDLHPAAKQALITAETLIVLAN